MVWRAEDPATGKPVQRSRMFEGARHDAVRAANELEAAQRREPVSGTRGVTLAGYLAEWQAWRCEAGNVAEKTAYRDGQYIKVINGLIGERKLAHLGARDLDHLTAALRQQGYASVTVHNTWATLRKALRQAARWKLLSGTPWEGATVPTVPRASPQPPSVAETLRLAALLEPYQPIAAVLVHTMLATGARKSELLALRWEDIDLDRAVLSIHRAVWEAGGRFGIKDQPKNAASRRSVALPGDCVARLRVHKAWVRERQMQTGRAWNPDDLVFPAPQGGLWRPCHATRVVGYVARKHGLATGLHNRRHTHAVLLLEQQVPIKVVADRLGHADPAMTLKVYQHVTEQASALAVQALDRSLRAVEVLPSRTGKTDLVDSAVDSVPGD
jgi:integrase